MVLTDSYDKVLVSCPKCGERHEVRSRTENCKGCFFYPSEVPALIAHELHNRTVICVNCQANIRLEIGTQPAETLRLTVTDYPVYIAQNCLPKFEAAHIQVEAKQVEKLLAEAVETLDFIRRDPANKTFYIEEFITRCNALPQGVSH